MNNDNQHIPSGYKPSPLGPIPEDWEVKRLGEVCDIDKESLSNKTDPNYEFDYISLSDVDSDCFETTTSKQKFRTAPSRARRIVKQGDVIISTVRPNLQAFTLIKDKVKDLIVSTGFAVLTPKQIINEYLYQYVFSYPVSKQFYQLVVGSNYPAVNSSDVSHLKIAFPPLSEQHRIVSVLSLWDTAIAKQTALIEQLTLRKRGLMQQLLTGKKRLKGFEGGSFHRLGNYISECNRRNNGCNRVLSVTNTRGFILQEEQFDKIVASNDTSNYKVVRRGEFAYNPSRVNVGSLAMQKEYDEGILSPMYIVFKANENIDKTYLLQCLQSWWFRGHIPAYTQGSVRDSLSFDGLCSMKFYIPTLQEQKTISAILERADKEIEIQKQKLAAMQAQKKGLMQVLLTGKKRINK